MSRRVTARLYQAGSLLCLAGIAIPATAVAAEAAPAASSTEGTNIGSQGLEEIVVTANKREEWSSKVGLSIQAIGEAALEQEHVATLQDLANATPALTFTETENSTPVYTLRGVGFYETSLAAYPDVSVYLDQAPLPFPAQTALTLFDMQRVEVLKGPQGTLFGNNATGGAINYIANKPTADFTAGTQLSYGRFNTGQVDGFVSGPLGNTMLGRIAFSVTEGDTWQHSQTRDDTNGKPDKIAVRAILDWHPTDALRFELNVNGWHDGTEPQQPQDIKFQPTFPSYSPAINQPPPPNNALVADWPAAYEPRAHDDLVQAFIRADYDVTDTIAITSITNYIHYARDETPVADGSEFIVNNLSQNTGWIESYSQELRVAGGGAGPFRWLGGLEYSGDHVWERDTDSWLQGSAFTFPLFAGTEGNSNNSNQKMNNYAAFAHGEYDLLEQLTLKAGVRGTEADRKDVSCGLYYRGTTADPNGIIQNFAAASGDFLAGRPFTPVGPNQCAMIGPPNGNPPYAIGEYTSHLNQNNVSWSTGIDWKPTDTMLTYVNVSRGYKAGGFPTLPASYYKALAPVTQEKLTDYEAGIKAQFLDHHLSVNAAAFYYQYTDKQLKSRIIDPLFGILTALVNIPKSSIRGAELDIHARPLTGLDIGAAATYLDAKVDQFTGVNQVGQVADFAGASVPYTPKWALTGTLNYQHPLSETWAGFLGAQVTYRSETTAAIGSPALYLMPSYSVLDLQAGVESRDDRWRVFLWGKNVLNRFYVNNVVQQEDDVIRYTGMPVSYGITVNYRFR
jgi:iron complex outermembrane recepter protein